MSISQSSDADEHHLKPLVPVGIRLMFQRIGEIDTLNEKYQAQASIEARWIIPFDELFEILPPNDQNSLNQGKSVSLIKYADNHWYPQLFIENAVGDLKEQIRYTAKKISEDQACICEHRDIKGAFWEKLELYHFPSDIQELTISIGSMLYNDRVILIPDPFYHSGVNREAFVDQQEWLLYEHVDAEQRFVKEYFNSISDDKNVQSSLNEGRKRSIVSVSCHAARRSGYFYWNGYCLIFLITICGFTVFSMPPNLPQNRLQTGATLLLTSITFRWTVNRSLPTISYLTSLDKYAIISIFILVSLCIWHAIIGAIIYIDNLMGAMKATDEDAWTINRFFDNTDTLILGREE
ncbi:unnamed protein product [Rotaria magnacalcarata]|uniref:Neurotransmitter-gated ion-channel ligand-binding domain-containing protein n=1 Tax=Rotaria magnacalcarata TaxID=392030 RepID=A0A820BZ80_9BILA|nr:unnamed protein product [Rotaria magnacalcarata]